MDTIPHTISLCTIALTMTLLVFAALYNLHLALGG